MTKKEKKERKAQQKLRRVAYKLQQAFAKRNDIMATSKKVIDVRQIQYIVKELTRLTNSRDLKRARIYNASGLMPNTLISYRRPVATLQALRTSLNSITDQAVTIIEELNNAYTTSLDAGRNLRTPSIEDIMSDIERLKSRFDVVELKNGKLVVTTKNIILSDDNESVDLGRFEMALSIDDLSFPANNSSGVLFIKSLDKVRPMGGDIYYHPHVTSDELCMGDGTSAADLLLSKGLLFEWFLVIYTILNTYNDASPYLSLSYWYRVGGDDEDDPDRVLCEECDRVTYWGEGAGECAMCHNTLCDQCGHYCELMDQLFCSACVENGCKTDCSERGSLDCKAHENEPCLCCGDVLNDGEISFCPATGKTICYRCIETDENPCMKIIYGPDGGSTQVCAEYYTDSNSCLKCEHHEIDPSESDEDDDSESKVAAVTDNNPTQVEENTNS